jgi:two-component system cell cycle sensor histidine kinase PleC
MPHARTTAKKNSTVKKSRAPSVPTKKTSKNKTTNKVVKKPQNKTTKAKVRISNRAEKIANQSRMAVDQGGIIIQTTPEWSEFKGKDLQSIINFIDPDEAIHDRPSFGVAARANPFVSSIVDGTHDVRINGAVISLQFDHMVIDQNRSVLMISTVEPTSKTSKSKSFDVQVFLEQTSIISNNLKITPSISSQSPLSSRADLFANMSHDLMVMMDRQGNIIDVNETFTLTMDYTMADLSDFTFIDLVHPDDRGHIRPTFKSLVQGETSSGQVIAFECRVMARDQNIHWLEWRMKRDEQNIYAICRDLTDAKRSEEQMLRGQQQLSEAQRLGRMGHWIWRVGEQDIFFSDEIYRIFGVTKDDFKPTIDSVNSMLHRRDVGRMAQAFQRAMIEQKNYDMEFRVMRPNGQARFIQLQGRCEFDSEGEVTSLFGIMQDVTERTQHERELREAKESAERAYAAKSQFLANMSHELRTPLNAIIGFSEMIQRQLLGPIGTEKYLDYITGIRESGEHLLDLITDILDMSKIEAGKYQLDVETFNMMKVLRLAAHMIEGRALDAQVKIISEIPEDQDLDVTGDRRAVMQVVLNILSNAVKFTEPGGEVRLSQHCDGESILVRIQDTGIGIPPSKLRYVTEPFEQAANHFTRNHEGSGLGLAITKELIELHGGHLTIESTVGVGTIVTFQIPLECKSE